MILIGIGNKAQHGKDTAAAAILAHAASLGLPILRVSWADALYEEVNSFLRYYIFEMGLSIEDVFSFRTLGVDDSLIKPPSWVQPTPNAEISERAPYGKHSKLLQWWGTEFRRAQDPDYWVKKGTEVIEAFRRIHPNGVVVVPDVRFFNEVGAIQKMGGELLRVSRINKDGTPYVDPSRDANHSSETELDAYLWPWGINSDNPETTKTLAVEIFEHLRTGDFNEQSVDRDVHR